MSDWKAELEIFKKEMEKKLEKNIQEKGAPDKRNCEGFYPPYMLRKMNEHVEAGNYADAANYLFMLWNGNGQPIENNPNKTEAKENEH